MNKEFFLFNDVGASKAVRLIFFYYMFNCFRCFAYGFDDQLIERVTLALIHLISQLSKFVSE